MILLRSNSVVGSSGVLINGSASQLQPTSPPTAASVLIATHGDSITRDFVEDTSSNYIFTVATGAVSPRVRPRGINGVSWNFRWTGEPYLNDMIVDAPIAIDPLQDGSIPNWLILFAGTNGIALNSNSASQELDDFETYIQARNTAGWAYADMVICTMLPRDPSITEATRTSYNDGLISRAVTFGYNLARFDLDPDIGQASDNLDITYYYDGVHLNETGHAVAGGIIKDVIFP